MRGNQLLAQSDAPRHAPRQKEARVTRLGKKKRHREVNPVTGKVFYREHWRHVQYDTDAQIAANFFISVDYQQYLAKG